MGAASSARSRRTTLSGSWSRPARPSASTASGGSCARSRSTAPCPPRPAAPRRSSSERVRHAAASAGRWGDTTDGTKIPGEGGEPEKDRKSCTIVVISCLVLYPRQRMKKRQFSICKKKKKKKKKVLCFNPPAPVPNRDTISLQKY